MNLRSIVRDGLGSLSRRRKERVGGRGISYSEPTSVLDLDVGDGSFRCWEAAPPELLRDVARRLEAAWPERRDVVAFASVCRSWRDVCREIVGVPETTGKITFPVALKLPGSRNGPIQCYIKRNKSTSTYQLFLGLDTERGKFLLAARKIRRPTYAEYVISLSTKDISCNNLSYMGKLRSNFLGTKFAIYDSQPPYKGAVASSGHPSRRFYRKKVLPKVPSGSYGIAHVAYELNMLGTRGPRRMHCAIYSIPASSLEPNGTVPPYYDTLDSLEDKLSSMSLPHPLEDALDNSKLCESGRITSSSISSVSSRFTSSRMFTSSTRFTPSSRFTEVSISMDGNDGPLILRNKPPRWHEQLQCWCLNFRGRVTVASVKNFQLIAASGETVDDNTATAGAGTSQSGSSDRDKIILQFGKIGKDLFTMDYRYPLSAFQAFAICLSSFDSKLACE